MAVAVAHLAGVIGAMGALMLSWVLSRYLFEITWHALLGQKLAGIVLTAVAVGVVRLDAVE